MILEPKIVATKRSDKLKEELQSLEEYLGESLFFTSVEELTRLPHRRGYYAVPPEEYWEGMKGLLDKVWKPLRRFMGAPVSIRAYRPPEYNRAAGGKPGSRHQWASAFDLRSDDLDRLKLGGAMLYLQHGIKMEIGFGCYSNNIHLDHGWKRRTWGSDSHEFIKRAAFERKEESQIWKEFINSFVEEEEEKCFGQTNILERKDDPNPR